MKRRFVAFTLVELLVVIGIISILISILMPALSALRVRGNRIACAGNLNDIGKQFQMYLNDSHGILPYVDLMPSVPLNTFPSIREVLQPYAPNISEVYHCPSDVIGNDTSSDSTTAIAPSGFLTYFDREKCSYYYELDRQLDTLRMNHDPMHLNALSLYKDGKQNLLRIMHDWEAFHGPPGSVGSQNHLFADWHVGDLVGQ